MHRHFFKLVLLTTLLALTAIGCSDQQAAVNQVGVNVVEKSLFTGSWYYSRTVIDVDYEAAGFGTYPGDSAIDFAGGGFTTFPRIRWVIDEDTLYAYRDYELLEGANPEHPAPGEHLGHPVAAFAIDSQFDIHRAYNPATHEEVNTIIEDSSDRRWYERDYMRVDWSKNLLPGYYGQIANLYEVLGVYSHEPADLYIQQQSDFPDSWRPHFDFMTCTGLDDTHCPEGERDYAEDYAQGDLYHISFVTQELLSPGIVPDPFTGQPVNYCLSPYSGIPICSTVAIFVRNSFMKVSDTRQYEAQNWNDSRFARHGYFRNERDTVDRMSSADDPAYGYTDFLNYTINRHNIWRQWYTQDSSGNRTSVPYLERHVRPIVFYATPELPAHLVQPAMDLVGEWNTVFMNTVRGLRGLPLPVYPRQDCQTTNPDAYCFCEANPATGEILNSTCAGRYDLYETTAEAEARGITNPYDCHVEVPAGAEPIMTTPGLADTNFYGWYDARFVGSECVNVLRMNTCNRASIAANGGTQAGLDCQERGDMRYKFVSYVDQPGTAFLGIATMRGDPVSGEIMAGDANVGGPALDGYRTFAMQNYDLINGTLTDRDFVLGEDVRGYLESLNVVQEPNLPRVRFLEALRRGETQLADPRPIDNQMARFVDRAQRLAGPAGRANTFMGRRNDLAGTDTERRLMENWETLAMAGVDHVPAGMGPHDITDTILDQTSPFRTNINEQLDHSAQRHTAYSNANMLMPNEYVDASITNFVHRHADWDRNRLQFTVNRLLFFDTELHEYGHCMGLRHDFGGSVDSHNYFDNYYEINDRLPLPDPAAFDTDGTLGFSTTEQQAYEDAYASAKQNRELAGIEQWMNSSIMEYTAQWYERTVTQAGRYDNAAIADGYGDLVEVYDNSAGKDLADLTPANTPRLWAKYYFGGEACSTDADCPYSATGSRSGELNATNTSAGLTQTCVPSPNGEATHGRVCSDFDTDVHTQATGPAPRWAPVDYRFCSDDRVGTLGWCHRFDEGENYREIVKNVAAQYDRQYIFTNFRRYRASFGIGSYLGRVIDRQFNILQTIFQNLLWQYQSDPAFRSNTGDLGFYDEFLATADILNFYNRILAQPDVGIYQYDPGWKRYERVGSDPNATGAELRMPIGPGRYFSSEYQRGLSGIFRVERVGSFYDKWITMQMLTQRGYTQEYTRDIPFWTNYFDLFPVEMQQVFQGMIQDEPEVISPRVECGSGVFPNCVDPRLVYMDLYRGDCSDPAHLETCRPDPVADTYASMPVLNGGSAITLQFLAVIYALSDFPTFFDTTFANQLYVCVEGNGTCYEPGPDAVEGTDYVRYASTHYGKTFIAWQVEPTEAVANQTSLGFAMVKEAGDDDFLYQVLQKYRGDFGGGLYDAANLTAAETARVAALGYVIPSSTSRVDLEIDRLDGRRQNLESFLFQIIQLEQQLGVASYRGF